MGEGEGGKGAEGGCDKYPKNRAGSRLAGEIRKGKTRIKGEEAATERGLGNIKRKKIRRRTKERITQVWERHFLFLLSGLLLVCQECSLYIVELFTYPPILIIRCLGLPLWYFYPMFLISKLCKSLT